MDERSFAGAQDDGRTDSASWAGATLAGSAARNRLASRQAAGKFRRVPDRSPDSTTLGRVPPMKTSLACVLLVLLTWTAAIAAPTDDVYQLGPDSAPHPGVPHGSLVGPTTLPSNVFPNTF